MFRLANRILELMKLNSLLSQLIKANKSIELNQFMDTDYVKNNIEIGISSMSFRIWDLITIIIIWFKLILSHESIDSIISLCQLLSANEIVNQLNSLSWFMSW